MKITTLVPPAASAVSLEQARAFLRVDYSGEDDLLDELIRAATARIEAETGLRLMPQTIRVDYDCWPEEALAAGRLELPVRPVRGVTSIVANGEDVSGDFEVLATVRPTIAPVSFWPSGGDSVSITLEAGYASAEAVPSDIKLALRMLAADAYRRREGEANDQLDEDIARLLAPWRRVRL